MNIDRKISVVTFALLMSNFSLIDTALAQELNTEAVEEGQTDIGALVKAIDLQPECTQTFIYNALSINSADTVETILAAIKSKPESIIDIVVAAVQAQPDLKDTILKAALDTIDISDVTARTNLVKAVEALKDDNALAKLKDNNTCEVEYIAELEEVEPEPEDLGELEEAPEPTPIPAPPAFNPGSDDKPIGISPN